MRLIATLVVCTWAITSTAYAQTPPHPDCAKLPGGGKIRVDVPGVIGPPTCQACAPNVQVPANFVLGFSDNSRATCELKRPDGTNSGLCRANSQCPAGTQRIMQNGAWACQAPATFMEVSCPAVPRAPEPPRTTGRVQPPPCVEQMKAAERRLKERETAVRQAVGNDVAARGTALANSAGKRAESTVMLAASIALIYTEVNATTLAMVAACEGHDKNNPTAVADCTRATGDYNRSVERFQGFWTRYENADRASRREWETATQTSAPGPAINNVVSEITRDAQEAARQAEACVAELKQMTTRRPF